ncbi:hypothetical protein BDV38DRAFT_95491 [Aspergillus pseudotamarii]|uniref:Uncharacterized protein n=1 Tax=Aspergillus pseudotamarii TaxID=132259 RepID=A0A5N6T9W6_ASPPS|nr:uncharacterized protein BDV38DRAFT_95491 [Aspergillus pseudotamarii]KAE8142979.1 hypothetical protein BDV38DRAFT_95491 [Aspergillus pseudotamarii]
MISTFPSVYPRNPLSHFASIESLFIRPAMCLCTYHHYPCGHIASFTFESCIDITNLVRANINPLNHHKIKKLDLLNERRPHRCFKCEENSRGASTANSNQSSSAANSKYIPLEGDTADFPIIIRGKVIQSMGQSGYCLGWDADISSSDERPASSKSLVKTFCLSRRIKHRRDNGYHRNPRVASQRAPGSSRRIKTLSQDLAATIEEDPGYEAEDDERGRSILKSRRYPPQSQGYIHELTGSFPESDQSVYDTAPEATTPLSEGGSSDLAHESSHCIGGRDNKRKEHTTIAVFWYSRWLSPPPSEFAFKGNHTRRY